MAKVYIILMLYITVSPIELLAQFETKKIYNDLRANYLNSSSQDESGGANRDLSALDVSLNSGFTMSSNLVLGFGFEYGKSKEEVVSELIPIVPNPIEPSTKTTTQIENLTYGVSIFGFGLKDIAGGLFGSLELRGTLGKINQDSKSIIIRSGSNIETTTTNDKNFWSVSLRPGTVYSLHDKYGVRVNFGGLSYYSENGTGESGSNAFEIDLNPRNWTLGFCFIL